MSRDYYIYQPELYSRDKNRRTQIWLSSNPPLIDPDKLGMMARLYQFLCGPITLNHDEDIFRGVVRVMAVTAATADYENNDGKAKS